MRFDLSGETTSSAKQFFCRLTIVNSPAYTRCTALSLGFTIHYSEGPNPIMLPLSFICSQCTCGEPIIKMNTPTSTRDFHQNQKTSDLNFKSLLYRLLRFLHSFSSYWTEFNRPLISILDYNA